MTILLTAVLALATSYCAALSTFFLTQAVAGASSKCNGDEVLQGCDKAEIRPTVAVVVPAHDEALVIADTVLNIAKQLQSRDRLVVVADNCSDGTAALAHASGATVVERKDFNHRGKGFALDFAVQTLKGEPPDVVVVIDADCRIGPNALTVLAFEAVATQRPVQALNLMHPPADSRLQQRIAAFAWRVKNQLRPLGNRVLGFPVQLMGTGFALPWSMAKDVQFATENIVEDMQVGLDMAVAGVPVRFVPQVYVESYFPEKPAAIVSQRRRWEHGHIKTMFSQAPAVFFAGLKSRRVDLVWLALDVAVPPLALFALINLSLSLISIGLALETGTFVPLKLSLIGLLFFFFAVLLAWWKVGREFLSFWDLACVPWYILRKLPIYLGFLTRRQRAWVRTERDDRP